MSPVETMQLGKLITLEAAARKMAEKDSGYFDLRWTLRFCMESYVRLCIRIPHNINTWEREQEPDYGESCGKCGEISDQREAGRYEDADEADMPQYCDNCMMTKPPVMGAGDFIGQRWGVLFIQSSEVQALIYPETEVVRCRVLYDLDDTWSGGYCRFEVASEYESMKDELDKECFEGEDFSELLSQQSRKNYLSIGLPDLLVWKEDFESALQGGETESRKALPMNHKDASTKNSSTSRVINKMAVVIYGMAVTGFGYEYTPDKRNPLTGEKSNGIPAKLQQAGINVDPEVLRGYLKQGAELSVKK